MGLVWSLLLVEGLFLAGVLGQLVAAVLAGARVELVSFGFGPPLIQGRLVQLAAFPLGGFVRIAGLHATEAPVDHGEPRAFFNRPWPLRLLVVLGWPAGAQAFLALLVVCSELAAGVPDLAAASVVSGVVQGSSAELAGVRVGDVIVSANGEAVAYGDLSAVVQRTGGRPFELVIMRGGVPLRLELTAHEIRGGGFRIGVQVVERQSVRRPDVATALRDGALEPIRKQRLIVESLISVASGRIEAEVGGPVGIARAALLEQSAAQRAQTLELIAAYVVLWSLLPLPPLPGGQLLLFLFGWRSLRRRSPTAARDAGPVLRPRVRFPVALLAVLLPPAAAVVVGAVTGTAEDIGGAVGWLVLAAAAVSGRPRAWAWCVYVPLLMIPPALLTGASAVELALRVAALCLVPATLLSPPVRRYFQQACPICRRLAGHPVRSGSRTCCLACGSTWSDGGSLE